MKITAKLMQDIVVITLSGPMMGGPETVEFHELIKWVLQKKYIHFVIDLGKVKWMNSSGLGVLLSAFGSVCRVDDCIKLVRVSKKVRSLLIIVQIITFFETYESIEAALHSFQHN